MRDVFFQDETYRSAAHLDIEECEVLRDYHQKQIVKLERKIDSFQYRSDGSSKFYDKIGECQRLIFYHQKSIEKAQEIFTFLQAIKQ